MAADSEGAPAHAHAPNLALVGKRVANNKKLATLMKGLASHAYEFEAAMAAASELPATHCPGALFSALAQAFNVPVQEINKHLQTKERMSDFDHLVPKSGWLRLY